MRRQKKADIILFPGVRAGEHQPIGYQDLNDLLTPSGTDTWIVSVEDDDEVVGLLHGDRVMVRRDIMPKPGDTVIVEERGDLLTSDVKGIRGRSVFGVVTFIVRQTRF